MGLLDTDIDLISPRDPPLKPIQVSALVDTGAITLCIPEHRVIQLKLTALEKREVTTAEGKKSFVPYVGPIQVRFENRNCFTGALVIGDAVLLGAIPLEDMDLVIDSRSQHIAVNPQNPNIPAAVVKSIKVDPYLAKGAEEVWICAKNGKVEHYEHRGRVASSKHLGKAVILSRGRYGDTGSGRNVTMAPG